MYERYLIKTFYIFREPLIELTRDSPGVNMLDLEIYKRRQLIREEVAEDMSRLRDSYTSIDETLNSVEQAIHRLRSICNEVRLILY